MSTIRTNAILDAAGGNTATVNGVTVALASLAEAQAGTDNTKLMTPLRAAQAIAALSTVLLGTLTTTSGSTQSLSGLNLASYKFVVAIIEGVNCSPTANPQFAGVTTTNTVGGAIRGFIIVELANGHALLGSNNLAATVGAQASAGAIANTNLTNASTSIAITCGASAFTAGTVRIYGMR